MGSHFVLLGAAVVGKYLYGELSVVARAAGVIVLIAAALGVAATTTKGKEAIVLLANLAWKFAK